MGKHGKTHFQDRWLEDPELSSWILRAPCNMFSAKCKLCPGANIDVKTMGRSALISHAKGSGHKKKSVSGSNLLNYVNSVQLLSSNRDPVATTSSSTSFEVGTSSAVSETRARPSMLSTGTTYADMHPTPSTVSLKQNVLLNLSTLQEKKLQAEVLWCLESVYTHTSLRKAARDVKMMKLMFPDSEIAASMQLERTKISYMIVFGLAHHFREELQRSLQSCDYFVAAFDESLNKISQSQQMDLVVRFWDKSKNEVATRYLTSVFLHRSTAAHLLEAFLAGLPSTDTKKLLQVSLDGPNVNKKFLKDLNSFLTKDCGNSEQLLDIGTCGLHTIHCAFKTAMDETGWNLVAFLRAIYNLFKNSPARRGIFIDVTNASVFPKKFCAVRWLENIDVAHRAIEILPNLRKFVEAPEIEKKMPTCASFHTVKTFMKDHLLGAKLGFFIMISSDLKPFLTEFQSNSPLVPFLHAAINNIVVSCAQRFVEPNKVKEDVDVNKTENLLPAKKVNVGMVTLVQLKNCKASQLEIGCFKNECRAALKVIVNRLQDRSPLGIKLTRYVSCFDPAVAVTPVGKERLQRLLIHLAEKNRISSIFADKVQRQFNEMLSKKNICDDLKAYSRKTERLDHFWMKVMERLGNEYKETLSLLKMILIISHGNAEVERGFSINKEVLIENMREESLIGYRIVYDAINAYGGIEKVPLTKSLLFDVKKAYNRYSVELKARKEVQNKAGEEREKRKLNERIVRELETKRARILEEAQTIKDQIEKLA